MSGALIPGVDKDGTEFLRVRHGAEHHDFSLWGVESLDLSDILASLAAPLPDPGDGGEPCALLADWSQLADHLFALSVWNGAGEDSGEIEIYAFRGGYGRHEARRLAKEETDIFADRFLNANANIFLTTRPGRTVTLRESEICPLLFFTKWDDQEARTLEVFETIGDTSIEYPLERGGLYALDPAAMRADFATQKGVLPSILEIHLDGEYTTRIIIAAEDPEPERYRLKFRNSYGVFEIFAVRGPLTLTPTYEEDNIYRQIDQSVGDFIDCRGRATLTETMEVRTDLLDRRATAFFFDLVGSEEVWLLDYREEPVRVIPSISEVAYQHRPEAPCSFRLTLTPADSDLYVTPSTGGGQGGIFTREFNPPFN